MEEVIVVDKFTLDNLKTMTFWKYVKLKKCLSFGAFPDHVKPSINAPNIKTKSLVIGLFYHDLLEKLNSCSTEELKLATKFNTIFNNLLKSFKEELGSSAYSRHLSNLDKWPEITQIYNSVFVSFSNYDVKKTSRGRFKTEEILQSKDGKITGKIDAFFVDDSHISLIDYKSSDFDGEVSSMEEYKSQLYLYAYLLQENFGTYPVSLNLIDRNNNVITIPPAPSISMEIASKMRSLLSEYNKKINADANFYSHANPSIEGCRYCKMKPFCGRFWEEKNIHGEIGKFNHVIIGKQINEIKKTAKGGCIVTIKVSKSTIQSEEISVGRLFMARFPNLKDIPGQMMTLTNLKNISDSSYSAEFTDQSIIYLGD